MGKKFPKYTCGQNGEMWTGDMVLKLSYLVSHQFLSIKEPWSHHDKKEWPFAWGIFVDVFPRHLLMM